MSTLNKRMQSFVLKSGSLVELNQVLALIERRIDQAQGIGQNADLHGRKVVRTKSGTSAGEVLTTEYQVPDASSRRKGGGKASQSIQVRDGAFTVIVKPDAGLRIDSRGVGLKKQPPVSDPVSVSALTLNSGSDSIDRGDANTKLSTLTSEVNAIKDVLLALLEALRAADILAR